jgi:hypothetical protein
MSRRVEDALQRSVATYLLHAAHPSLIWFHCPNGERRNAITGAKLKAMGVRAGVADLCLVLPGGRAAFLELKAGRGRQSPTQKLFAQDCATAGALYAVARSLGEVIAQLTVWGALKTSNTSATAVRGAEAGGAAASPDLKNTEALGVPA